MFGDGFLLRFVSSPCPSVLPRFFIASPSSCLASEFCCRLLLHRRWGVVFVLDLRGVAVLGIRWCFPVEVVVLAWNRRLLVVWVAVTGGYRWWPTAIVVFRFFLWLFSLFLVVVSWCVVVVGLFRGGQVW